MASEEFMTTGKKWLITADNCPLIVNYKVERVDKKP